MEDSELFSFLEKRRGLLDGVAITGGEPCLHPGLPELMRAATQNGVSVGVSGIRVTLDGYTVGRLVAPYVSQEIAKAI